MAAFFDARLAALIERLTQLCLQNQVIGEADAPTFRYGLDLLLFSLMTLAVALVLGVLFGVGGTVLWLLLVYLPLQGLGGGYHAQTHLQCFLTSLGGLVLGVLLARLLPGWILLLLALPAAAAVFRFAPVEHPKAPFGPVFAARMRRIVRRLAAFWLAAALVGLFCGWPPAGTLATGVLLSGISIITAVWLEERKRRAAAR